MSCDGHAKQVARKRTQWGILYLACGRCSAAAVSVCCVFAAAATLPRTKCTIYRATQHKRQRRHRRSRRETTHTHNSTDACHENDDDDEHTRLYRVADGSPSSSPPSSVVCGYGDAVRSLRSRTCDVRCDDGRISSYTRRRKY